MFKNLISQVAFETMEKFATNFNRLSSNSNFAIDYSNLDDLDSEDRKSTLLNEDDANYRLVGLN